VRSRAVAVTAFALLAGAFVADVLTPQTLVVAILLDVPIVLAALTRSRRLTAVLVTCALAADAGAAIANAAHDGYRWDAIVVGDRLLSMLSIAIVGYLSTAVQERAERVGRLAAQEARARREATLAGVAERIRASLSPELVVRAIVREAPRALELSGVFWYPAGGGEILAARAGDDTVEVIDERPSPEIASLTHRVAADGTLAVIRAVDPLGRFVLDRLRARSALAIPLADRGTPFGVLVAASDAEAPDDTAIATAKGFAAISVNALWQARLFAELADRNDALGDRQAVIRDLVYALSHDLRTPLAALSMTLRQAADGAYGALPERYGTVLHASLGAIDDLQGLAETLLLVARFEAGEHRAERELVDLGGLAGEIAAGLRAMADAREITLRLDVAADATTVRGSRGDLRRALSNLVANALQHTPAGGTVELRVAPRGASVETVVADDGFGIDERVREGLFARFSATARTGGGTGLGLYIVRRIAEESGGTVRYEPRSARGSVFTLTIPKAAP
jgi:signal transduction histidine kinase